MNADRRVAGTVLIELLREGDLNGEISDEAHRVIGETLAHMHKAEYYQMRTQEKHEGSNASTDKQLAICRVALAALEKALHAYNGDDFVECIFQVNIAVTTDGSTPQKFRRKNLKRRSSKTKGK